MVDNAQPNLRRSGRVIRLVSLLLPIMSASLAVYWLTKWLRGLPDEYPNEIIGGLTLTTAMTLLTSAELA